VLDDRLRAVVSEALRIPDLTISDLRQLTGGASRQTWSFTAEGPGLDRRVLILRRDPPNAQRGGMDTEAAAFALARAAGVPEPEVIAHSDTADALGAPFIVMSYVEGETLGRRIVRDDEFAAVRPRLAEQCGEILAQIHAIAPAQIPGIRSSDPVEELRRELDMFTDSTPQLELGLRWLELNRPPANEPTLVHGDFRNGNLIIGPDGVRAVLDWELVHRGDPMEDLGYLCVRAWRFGGEKPVGGLGDYDDLFRGYERVSGRQIDREVVRWWEVVGTVRWGVGCMHQAWRHLSGQEPSVELAAIGRRVREQEYDLMLLLAETLTRV
jgi:aminoglycoside phosphotransferase (APT) family kinase protein